MFTQPGNELTLLLLMNDGIAAMRWSGNREGFVHNCAHYLNVILIYCDSDANTSADAQSLETHVTDW